MYRIADAQGKLPICVQQLRGGDQFFQAPERASRGEFDQDNVSDRLRGGIMKLFMDPVYPLYGMNRCHKDGSLTPEGEIYYTQEEVDQLVLAAARNGLQVAIHCIGDRAIDQGLNAFERAIDEVGGADLLRFRIEHMSFPRAAQIPRAARMPIVLSLQPPFLYSIGEMFQGVVDEFRLDLPAYPYRDLVDSGATIAAGSDFPCAPLPPLIGIAALANRRLQKGGERLFPEQAIPAAEAIRQYTNGSAYAVNRDHEVGSLEIGKRADMVVLSHDPTAVDPDYIGEIVVQQTYVDGRLLYDG
jgi:predicted amidohydrolase YtcJ